MNQHAQMTSIMLYRTKLQCDYDFNIIRKKIMFIAKRTALAAVGLCTVLAAGAARANVFYTFNPSQVLNEGDTAFGPLVFSLDLPDSAIRSTSFTLTGYSNDGINPTFSGDPFVGVGFPAESVTPAFLYGTLHIALTFDRTSGDVTSSSISFTGEYTTYILSGLGAYASGQIMTHDPRCNVSGGCLISGAWSPPEIVGPSTSIVPSNSVPEPATFAVLSVGLLGIVAGRRRVT